MARFSTIKNVFEGFSDMLEIGLISARIKDMQGRADVLRGYL